MRIAFVTFEYPPNINGGAGTYAENLTNELAKLGHEILVFTPDYEYSNESIIFNSNIDIIKVKINKKLPFIAFQFWLNLPSYLIEVNTRKKIDIIHFNGISYWFLIKRLLKDTPQIGTVHHLINDARISNNIGLIRSLIDISGENSFFLNIAEKRYINNIDKIIAVSNYTKQKIIDTYNVNESKIIVIPNGITLNDVDYTDAKLNEIRIKYNIPNDKRILLFVGRINDPRKGLDDLIRAFAQVSIRHEAILLIVGGGDKTNINKIVHNLNLHNNIILTGFVDDVTLRIIYNICDIYILPSKLEGFGLTLLDAMRAGKPIIATRVGAIPEIIQENENGILVEPNNIKSISDSINKLLEDQELSKFIQLKNKSQIGCYSWLKTAEKVYTIYMQLVG
jgi:glycosyltransferase involved in cell wall biosynthesis